MGTKWKIASRQRKTTTEHITQKQQQFYGNQNLPFFQLLV